MTSTTDDPHVSGPPASTRDVHVPTAASTPPGAATGRWCAMRVFEKRAYDLFMQNLVKGTSHLSLGPGGDRGRRSASRCGRTTTRSPPTAATRTRSRAARRWPACMGELLGRAVRPDGRQGRLDAPHRRRHGVMGSYAIVGAHLTDRAAAPRGRRSTAARDQVAVCFFGDGTTNIGAFHEALNFAAVWKLPVVFVCENNLYMEYTPIARGDRRRAIPPPIAPRAYGLEPIVVDGNDADAMYLTARDSARPRAQRRRPVADRGADLPARRPLARRSGQVPAARRRSTPGWRATRSLLYRARLLAARRRRGRHSTTIERDARRDVDDATEDAKASPAPGAEVLMQRRVGRRRFVMAELTYRDAVAARRSRRRWRATTNVVFLGEDIGGGRRRVQSDGRAARASSARRACATRRSPSRRSSARRWARR